MSNCAKTCQVQESFGMIGVGCDFDAAKGTVYNRFSRFLCKRFDPYQGMIVVPA